MTPPLSSGSMSATTRTRRGSKGTKSFSTRRQPMMGYDVWLSMGSYGSVVTWPSMMTSRRFVVFGITMFAFIGHLSGGDRDSSPGEKH